MPSSIDDIREQEEDIFEDLSYYDSSSLNEVSIGEPYPAVETAKEISCSVKNQARKQLAVSEDSPFSYIRHVDETGELRRLKEEKAARLRAETDAIKRQLDIVKARLTELKENGGPKNRVYNNGGQHSEQNKAAAGVSRPNSIFAGPHRAHESTLQVARPTATERLLKQSEPKFRPLTGKADCPNCTCDRRSSVCDQCINIAIIKPTVGKGKSSNGQTALMDAPKRVTYQDDRPIRPAKDRTIKDRNEVEVVDGSIVPNRVYTISKSLNDKRTKLAQAIDELHLMMDQVKEKSNKLEQERKLVQLYKDQWKFGPTIGGPIASARDRLGTDKKQQQTRRSYESRLDPNLTRDSKSLMGFQHVGTGMRLRNYNDTNNKAPTSILRTRSQPALHPRSKSLESLKTTTKNSGDIIRGKQQQSSQSTRPQASSDLAINKVAKPADEEELEEVAEEIEEEIRDNADERPISERHPSRVSPPIEVAVENGLIESNKSSGDKVQRLTWIPVFGETEIKTIKRESPKRKIQIVTPDSSTNNQRGNINQKLPMRSNSSLKRVPSPKRSDLINRNDIMRRTDNKNLRSGSNSRVMLEAQRKLEVCSNLLEQEQRDAVDKNQLIVNRPIIKPTPKPRQANGSSPASSNSNLQRQTKSGESNTHDLPFGAAFDTSREITRLEEMVNEQQRLLEKLAKSHDKPLVSPVTVSCSSPCCHHHVSSSNKTSGSSGSHRLISNPSNSKSLINILRDRLNKSKMRLARILEEEREKHEKLRQKVDSSLRKQSDLENENELLKQSLSKCIDTCLKDISNTFESLSITLDDSINGLGNSECHLNERPHNEQTGGAMLTNAAQLIADNRHLKQMRAHIEAIERQRKGIFDELSKEKQRSNQLEAQLKESQKELSQLMETKRELESRLVSVADEQSNHPPLPNSDQQTIQQRGYTDKQVLDSNQPTTSKQSTLNNLSSQTETTDKSDMDDTYSSVDVYRRYIQSMSPDLESMKQERMVILSEFDNIKKMLSDIET